MVESPLPSILLGPSRSIPGGDLLFPSHTTAHSPSCVLKEVESETSFQKGKEQFSAGGEVALVSDASWTAKEPTERALHRHNHTPEASGFSIRLTVSTH